jgi:hypothetical protein
VLRLRIRTAAGIVALLLAGAGLASERSSAGPAVANQTTIRFSVSEKSHRTVGKARELTRTSGSGILAIAETPQANAVYHSTSASGAIVYHRWRVVGGRVTDEENVTLDVVSGAYRFTKTTSTAVVQVTVDKTDSKETDTCAVGSTGELGLLDGKAATQPDNLGISACALHDVSYGGVKGQRAAVAITVTR